MAIINLGGFNAIDEGTSGQQVRVYIALSYNTTTNSFSSTQTYYRFGNIQKTTFTYPRIYPEFGGNRGYGEGEVFASQCSGINKLVFRALNTIPWATVSTEYNSVDCGFIVPVPPPPPAPPPLPPVCDLVVEANSTAVTGFGKTDGTVSGRITTSQAGNYVVNLVKAGTGDVVDNIVINADENTYSFDNVPPGNYTVKSNSIVYDCIAETNISVGDFIFNEFLYFLFCEVRFDMRKIRISIKKAGYSGVSKLIPNGSRNIIEISYPEKGSEMKFKPVLGSECAVNFIYEGLDELNEIYTDQEKQYLLEASFEETGEKIWSGFVLPEQSRYPFKNAPYAIAYQATDGIKTLEDIPFDISEGRITFLQGIKHCLDKTDVKLGFKTLIDIENIDSQRYVVLTGLEVNLYGNTIVVTPGTYTLNGVVINSTGFNITVPNFTANTFNGTIYLNQFGVGFLNPSGLPSQTTLLANVSIIKGQSPVITRVQNYSPDTLANHTFDVKRFVKEDGEFTDCYTVLEYICKQFTGQLKQQGGYWVIENIGAKGRGNFLESAYNNDLSVIYSNQPVNLLVDLDCDSENTVLADAYISNGAGLKRSIVSWKLGYPQPVLKNFNFERWVNVGGKLIPTEWKLSQPYDYFNRGSKFDRTYDPTTGIIQTLEVTDENRRYYFNFNNLLQTRNVLNVPLWDTPSLLASNRKRIVSSSIAVFNQEVLSISFQLIVTMKTFASVRMGFVFNLGNMYCRNYDGSKAIDPEWTTAYGVYIIDSLNNDQLSNPPYGDSTNINFELPKAPLQGYLTVSILEPLSSSLDLNPPPANSKNDVNVGFDNFKLKKSSPITGATVREEDIIIVENKKTFSTVPEPFEVYFGDVNNEFRTDGIKDLSNNPTTIWRRKGEEESDGINNIVAREILSQYQNTFRILEGTIIANNVNIRSVYNLPSYELYRFATITGKYNLLDCSFSGVIAEVYAEEGESSGPIGGGGNGQTEEPRPDILVIGYKNNILASENENIFQSNGD